uniref:Protein RER1 n=1 Tax=Salix viminalis TaxID=40686 RepID=A0A6N2ME06_SALVM
MEGFGDEGASVVSPVARWEHDAWRMYRYYLDRATPHTVCRWIGTLVMVAVYCSRLYYVRGFYIIVYGLGVYVVNLLSGFLSLLVDPEHEHSDGPLLPTKCFDEFKPLIRRLPEFKFWYSFTRAFIMAFVMTFFPVFDVPVVWSILLCSWTLIFFVTMGCQIRYLIRHKCILFNIGKQAEKVVLSSEGTESVHNTVALAPPLTDEGLQDPIVCEAAAGVYDWQPVPKKHTSNRQPKIGSVPADLVLGKDSSASNGKSAEAVGNVSGGTDLTALGSVAAGSAMGMGCVGFNGKPVGAVPQASAAADLAEADVGRNVQVSAGAGTLPTSAAIASPLVDAGLQDPMVCEAATDWEPVPKKLISNRQPKMKAIGSGPAAGSALGKVNAAAKGKSVEAVGIGSVDTGLMASGSVSAGST